MKRLMALVLASVLMLGVSFTVLSACGGNGADPADVAAFEEYRTELATYVRNYNGVGTSAEQKKLAQ